ncbi:MAG: hypothetical protein PHU28_03675 [Methanosarcinaceae archaeon]|nr:hypothetical protein [Methanosarcinaceae archaeon]
MKTRNILLIGVGIGLGLFGLFEFFSVSFTEGGILGAILIGLFIGKTIDKHPLRYAFFSVCVSHLLAFTLLFLFTEDGKLVLQEGDILLPFFLGYVLLRTLINSIIGTFGAFVSFNILNKQS